MRQQVDVHFTLDADTAADLALIKRRLASAIDELGKSAELVGDIELREEAEIYGNDDEAAVNDAVIGTIYRTMTL